jgi:N6-adenosine-specific RNA methylase IME4
VKPFLSNAVTVYDRIEMMFPGGKYLEVFVRSSRQGWMSWPQTAELYEELETQP